MRVAKDFRNRQYAARFEGTITLAQSSGPIRDFSEGGAKEYQVKTGFGDVRLGRIPEDRRQVRDSGSLRSNLEPVDHALLNVDVDRLTAR
ncbi:MAG: hypothetical protein ABSG53_11665 [Thermoguttaceae bacterium]